MKTLTIHLISVIFLFSCQNKPQPTSGNQVVTTIVDSPAAHSEMYDDESSIDTEDAVTWLTEVIETHFNEGVYPMEDICTPKYYEYKMDAIQVGYDGGMNEEVFNKKWSSDFDIEHAGRGTGFLISGQDWGTLKVTKCTPISDGKKGFLMLNVTIEDKELKSTYHRDIKIVPVGKAYLIDDVVEYD
ncbi:MAG: hypothetical protein H7X99_07165 [Saprospiraceae bacterium]|nr:hypothetical protein [Saprospiraceae bacterium]